MANMETTILPALPPSLLQSGWKENPAVVAWMRVFHSCLSVKDNPVTRTATRLEHSTPRQRTLGAGTAILAQLTASSKHPVESAPLVPTRIDRSSSSNGLVGSRHNEATNEAIAAATAAAIAAAIATTKTGIALAHPGDRRRTIGPLQERLNGTSASFERWMTEHVCRVERYLVSHHHQVPPSVKKNVNRCDRSAGKDFQSVRVWFVGMPSG